MLLKWRVRFERHLTAVLVPGVIESTGKSDCTISVHQSSVLLLKLLRFPRSVAATIAALPSVSFIPFSRLAPFMKTARLLTSSFLLLTFLACAAAAEKSHPQSDQSSTIANIVQKAMKTDHLRAVIVKVTQGDKVVINQAFGESMTGVPATTVMHFRNGAVAFSYLGTLLMQFVDEHKIKLDDTIERWMPDLPEANKVTLKMLANQTSGYPDFETDQKWLDAFIADPFHIWTFDERMKYAFSRPIQFDPGTNWSYSHTNFMILGEILSKIGNKPLDVHSCAKRSSTRWA